METTALHRDARTAFITFVCGMVFIGLGLTGLWSESGFRLPLDGSHWWFALPLTVACAALLVKRTAPVPALLVGTAALAADYFMGGSIAILLPFFDLVYTAALLSSARVRRVLSTAGTFMVTVPAAFELAASGNLQFAVLFGLQQAVIFLCPLWWAMDVRRKSELAEVAAARADALERLSAVSRQQAVRAERDALARDLHDVVASHLSAIALYSGGALATPPAPQKDRAALEQVRRSALDSMEEMRTMITLLRAPEPGSRVGLQSDDDGASSSGSDGFSASHGGTSDSGAFSVDHDRFFSDRGTSPLPRLSQLDTLLDTVRSNGLSVTLEQSVPAGSSQSRVVGQNHLSPATELVGYRIAQEALTNATKHAPGSCVSARLAHADGDHADPQYAYRISRSGVLIAGYGNGVDHHEGAGEVDRRNRGDSRG